MEKANKEQSDLFYDPNKKKYKLGNSNKSAEMRIVDTILAGTDIINDPDKIEYIRKRFMDTLFALDKLAIENKLAFHILRVIVLVTGILIPAVVNFNFDNWNANLIVTIMSIMSAISFGILQVFRNDIMWVHHRKQFEKIKGELYRYLTLSGQIYNPFRSHNEAFRKFAERCEIMFDQEISQYFKNLQIENKGNSFENTPDPDLIGETNPAKE